MEFRSSGITKKWERVDGLSLHHVKAHQILFTTGEGSDLVVNVDGTQYNVHQRFVCAGSPTLAKAYRPDAPIIDNISQRTTTGSIYLRGEQHDVVENILRYLYGLPVYFDSDKRWAVHDTIKLIQASQKYRLPKLPAAAEEAFIVYINELTEEYDLTLVSAETRKWLVEELARDLRPIMRNEDAWSLLLKYPELLRTLMTYLADGSEKVNDVAHDGRAFECKEGHSKHEEPSEEFSECGDSDDELEEAEWREYRRGSEKEKH
ncbi:hypothetical protein BST61_g10814 [Cercospora zeina]